MNKEQEAIKNSLILKGKKNRTLEGCSLFTKKNKQTKSKLLYGGEGEMEKITILQPQANNG